MTTIPPSNRIAACQYKFNMAQKLLITIGLLALVTGLYLIGSMLLTSPFTTASDKDAVLAEIIHNWQEAHPAEKRFVLVSAFNNDAVLDKDTELVWELSPEFTHMTWNEARIACSGRATGGQKGWRLPSPTEMRSLVGPAIDAPGPNISPGHPFLNIQQTSYWTVVPESNQPSYAQYVDAFLGNVLSFIKIYTFPVWCVRGPIKTDGFLME